MTEQAYEPIELIVVDDCSPTPAREVFESVATDDLYDAVCVRHDTNRGVNAARNTGIEESTGEFIAFLDDDDRWTEEKLAEEVGALRSAPENVGAAYCGAVHVKDGDVRDIRIPMSLDDDPTKQLLCHNVIGSMSVLVVERAVVDETGGLDERFPSWADLEWYIRLSRNTDFTLVDAPLVIYTHDSHGRLSEDFEKTRTSYRLFVEEFEPIAAEYGWLFRRKMLAWAAYRAGRSAQNTDHFGPGRDLLLRAVRLYPLEPKFFKFLVPVLGGAGTYRLARRLRDWLINQNA